MDARNDGNRVGRKIGRAGSGLNILLATGKIAFGIATTSMSVTADGINNLMDALSSILMLYGLYISSKPADRTHPYGHARAEYVAGLAIAIVTSLTAGAFLQKSFLRILRPEAVQLPVGGVLFLLLSVGVKVFLASWNFKSYRSYRSPIFRANATDSIVDCGVTLSVVISSYFFAAYPVLDGVLGMLIGCLILWQAFEALRETLGALLGGRPSHEDMRAIEQALEGCPYCLGMHNIVIDRRSMQEVFATADIEVNPDLTVREVHDALEQVTAKLKRDRGIALIVHIEPELDDGMRRLLCDTLKQIDEVRGVYDIVFGDPNIVTVAVDPEALQHRETIVGKVREKLAAISPQLDKYAKEAPWQIDVIVAFE